MAATAVDQEHRVTPRELFFDLVFVFAFTQVATLLADDPAFAGIGRGVLVLAALWWAWTAYAWLMNTVDPEEGVVGAALLVALIAMFIAALVVPGVFDGDGVLFGAAFLVVSAMHLALGEAFISIGIGATGIGIGLGEVVAAILGLLVAASFWLAYFDFFAIRGEQMLRDLEGAERVALARDAYAYAHFPLIVGVVLFAFAMKDVVGHVGEELESVTAFALCGGSGLYLLTFSAIRSRVERRVRLSRGRFVAALVLGLLLPVATMVPALAALGLVTAVWLALHTYELVWWREARAESRSLVASP
jgi:low temperature requirement protein LtrA